MDTETRGRRPTEVLSASAATIDVPEAMKERLRVVAASLDPVRLLDEIRTMQRHLAELAAGDTPSLYWQTETRAGELSDKPEDGLADGRGGK